MDAPVCPSNQTAVCLVAKQQLRNSEHDERIQPAADYCQHECGYDCAANMGEEVFHLLGQVKCSDDQIDQFNSNKRNYEPSEPVDQQVALQDRERAHRFVSD